jgi:hypothetical protein
LTTAIENLSSNSNINFLSTPNVLTMGSGNNSTKLASTAFAQNAFSTTNWLDVGSAQSISTTTVTPEIKINAVDTSVGGTLQLGTANDSSIQIGVSSVITMLGQVQPFSTIWKYWTTGCTNITALLGTAVSVQKIYAGKANMASASATINFVPAFTTTPIIVLGHAVLSGGSIALNSTNKWVSAVSTSSATINCNNVTSNAELHWIAVGN